MHSCDTSFVHSNLLTLHYNSVWTGPEDIDMDITRAVVAAMMVTPATPCLPRDWPYFFGLRNSHCKSAFSPSTWHWHILMQTSDQQNICKYFAITSCSARIRYNDKQFLGTPYWLLIVNQSRDRLTFLRWHLTIDCCRCLISMTFTTTCLILSLGYCTMECTMEQIAQLESVLIFLLDYHILSQNSSCLISIGIWIISSRASLYYKTSLLLRNSTQTLTLHQDLTARSERLACIWK